MKCPHCLVEIHDKPKNFFIGKDDDGGWGLTTRICPHCQRFIIHLINAVWIQDEITRRNGFRNVISDRLIYPKVSSRSPVPSQVPDEFAQDYKEACLVLADSPKASAALSRRCLQHILREKADVKESSLANEIQEVLDSNQLPSYLSRPLDSIRHIGNFAAHPTKSKSTGELVDVEPGEAEWNLDVIESLFDFFFVQPDLIEKKEAALNKKLKDADKPPMKALNNKS